VAAAVVQKGRRPPTPNSTAGRGTSGLFGTADSGFDWVVEANFRIGLNTIL
jgi:hypothetical protein